MSTSTPTNDPSPNERGERTRLGALLFLFRRRLLIVAFVLSLLVHLVVASGMRWPFTPPQEDIQTVHIEHLRTIRIARMPTPPPSPSTPQPRASAVASAKPAPRASAAGAGTGHVKPAVRPTAAPTPAPTPHPVATATCAGSDTAAAIVEKPSPPADIAPSVRGQATSGVARIRVKLDVNGTVTGTSIAQSSGNNALDFLAMTMARSARYAAATHDCKAVASEYLFSAKFVAW